MHYTSDAPSQTTLVRGLRTGMLTTIALLAMLALAAVGSDLLRVYPFPLAAQSLLLAGTGTAVAAATWLVAPRAAQAGRLRELTVLTLCLLAGHVMTATLTNGGVASVLPYLYAPIILAAAILLGGRSALLMATMTLGLHTLATMLEYSGAVQPPPVWGVAVSATGDLNAFLAPLGVLTIVFYALAVVAGQLADSLAESNRALGAAAELMRQEHLKTEFLTVLAHEVRTPLTSARGFLQLAANGLVPDDQLPSVIGRVQGNVDAITRLVNEIIFMQEADLVLDQTQLVDCEALLNAVIADHERDAVAVGIQLRTAVETEGLAVTGDESALRRALGALVDNALKFSPDGGDITVRLRRAGDRATFIVVDQGIGVAPEHLPHIFQRYYHTDRVGDHVFGGLGLGLSLARRLAEAHGGAITCASQSGCGSIFTLSLPIDTLAVKVAGLAREKRLSPLTLSNAPAENV